MKQEMKQQFRDQLWDWTKRELGIDFKTLGHAQQSRQMIHYFVSEVLGVLMPAVVPYDKEETESCIVDGAGDGGADLVYRSDSGHVLMIQAKYRNRDAKEEARDIGRFCDFPERLHIGVQGRSRKLHDQLLELADEINWKDDVFHCYYISTAKLSPSAHDRIDQGITAINGIPDFLDRVNLDVLAESDLNIWLRRAISSIDSPKTSIVIPMIPDSANSPWCHYVSDDGRDMYIGEVSGGILADLLQEHGSRLFTMNIRDYVGDSKTNQKIIQSALNTPEQFEYFNNGITAIAASISEQSENNSLVCERLSIINGAQTIQSLSRAASPRNQAKSGVYKPIRKTRVVFKLIRFDYPSESAFVSDVTRYNNTQNVIKVADFRSNDKVQLDLKRRFRNINLGGLAYDYKNKRSPKEKNTISIPLEEFTKTLLAFDKGPDDIFGGTSKLFDSTPDGLYLSVFPTPDDPLTDEQFAVMAGTYFICSYVRELWEKGKAISLQAGLPKLSALERRWIVYFAVGELLRQSYVLNDQPLSVDLARCAKPNNWMRDDSSPALALQKYYNIASEVLVQKYEDRKQHEGDSFRHRNWFRTNRTLEDIRKGITLALKFGSPATIWSAAKKQNT